MYSVALNQISSQIAQSDVFVIEQKYSSQYLRGIDDGRCILCLYPCIKFQCFDAKVTKRPHTVDGLDCTIANSNTIRISHEFRILESPKYSRTTAMVHSL
jgi:hypothetical protein